MRGPLSIGWCWHDRKVQDKSNEITAIPALLELLDYHWLYSHPRCDGDAENDCGVTIQQAQADYILSLKANHPTLFQEIVTWFQTARATDTLPMPSEHKTEAGHHRIELRSCWAISLDQLPPLYQSESWVGLQTIVIVERTRHLWNQTTHEIQFYRFLFACRQSQNCRCHSPALGN